MATNRNKEMCNCFSGASYNLININLVLICSTNEVILGII